MQMEMTRAWAKTAQMVQAVQTAQTVRAAIAHPAPENATIKTRIQISSKITVRRIQDLWMKNNPDFIGYNCRITAFGLMKDLITVQDTGGRNTEYLFLDEAALDAGELFTAEEREKFETVFSEIKTDASTDTKKQIGVQREYWKKAGVTFDGESKLSLITVYLHSHIDENENSLIAGHAGVLLDTGNEILFFEKISFELPYQLIRFEDRDQLKEYLMRCYDVDTTGECASPFILENDRVL